MEWRVCQSWHSSKIFVWTTRQMKWQQKTKRWVDTAKADLPTNDKRKLGDSSGLCSSGAQSRPRRFAIGRLENFSFFTQITCWGQPRFYSFRGLPAPYNFRYSTALLMKKKLEILQKVCEILFFPDQDLGTGENKYLLKYYLVLCIVQFYLLPSPLGNPGTSPVLQAWEWGIVWSSPVPRGGGWGK